MIFDGIKKIAYKPISFINNRAVPKTLGSKTVTVYLDEKSVTDNKILTLINSNDIVGTAISTSNLSINDNIQYVSFEYFIRNLDKFKRKLLDIEIGDKSDARTEFIFELTRSTDFFVKTFRSENKYEVPIRFLDNLYLERVLSSKVVYPLYPYNSELIQNESHIYTEALLRSGDISAYQINMKTIIALACLLDTTKSVTSFFTQYTDFKKYVSESDVHTLINIFWDMQIFIYQNVEYNELVSADKMDYIDQWCLRNKMNVEHSHKFVECYNNIMSIFESLYPISTQVNNLIYFPQYIFPIGVLQADDKRNENTTFNRGESKIFAVEGNYAAKKFVEVYGFNTVSALTNSVSLIPEQYTEYEEYRNSMQAEAIKYVYYMNIRVPIK